MIRENKINFKRKSQESFNKLISLIKKKKQNKVKQSKVKQSVAKIKADISAMMMTKAMMRKKKKKSFKNKIMGVKCNMQV